MEKHMHIPTVQELIELPTMETAQISPNGRFIAYEQSQPDWEKDSYISQIWLVSTANESEPQQLCILLPAITCKPRRGTRWKFTRKSRP